jgi:hypothetical protein
MSTRDRDVRDGAAPESCGTDMRARVARDTEDARATGQGGLGLAGGADPGLGDQGIGTRFDHPPQPLDPPAENHAPGSSGTPQGPANAPADLGWFWAEGTGMGLTEEGKARLRELTLDTWARREMLDQPTPGSAKTWNAWADQEMRWKRAAEQERRFREAAGSHQPMPGGSSPPVAMSNLAGIAELYGGASWWRRLWRRVFG